MTQKRRDESEHLEERLARIRELAEQFDHMHEMLARNSALLMRDREAIRSGVLRSVNDFGRVGCDTHVAAADERPRRLSRDRRRR